jgi:hypothetical protein
MHPPLSISYLQILSVLHKQIIIISKADIFHKLRFYTLHNLTRRMDEGIYLGAKQNNRVRHSHGFVQDM